MTTVPKHLFETSIGGHKCRIYVRKSPPGGYLVYSISDNETIVIAIQKKQDKPFVLFSWNYKPHRFPFESLVVLNYTRMDK